jgi:hypothetical protein
MADNEFLTPKQLADRWQRPEGTLRQWRHKNTGPAYTKLKGSVRYRLSDVEAFEKAGEKVTA